MSPKIVFVLAFFLSCPLIAVTNPSPPSRFVAAGWCVLHDGTPDDTTPECDMGLGVALNRWKQWALVGVVGTNTGGVGLAWIVPRSDPVISIAFGAVLRYDSSGIYTDEVYPAFGVTMNFWGRR